MPPSDSQPPSEPTLPSSRWRLLWQVAKNMGPRYVVFRAMWQAQQKTGLLARRFPTNPARQDCITLQQWQEGTAHFMVDAGVASFLPALPQKEQEKLQAEVEHILEGEVRFFSATWLPLGNDWDWHTHPETNFTYPPVHWTQIPDFSARSGDIKYVWEKARFSWVYTLARAHAHGAGTADMGAFVIGQIAHFITHNPINTGPQYRCSQEISLRILAWSFALSYWRQHAALTPALFADILHSIKWQLHHVRQAIHFSRIAVRNNHAITETAMLALAERLFPFFTESAAWAKEGKAWLEEEVLFQFYPEGGYLQHSTNYHRVALQVLTLVLSPAGLGPQALSSQARQRLQASLRLLTALQDQSSGWLPNLGNNDGALFFPLSASTYRDYRPALATLAAALGQASPYPPGLWDQEAAWWGLQALPSAPMPNTTTVFCADGYAVARHNQGQTITFLRAAAFRHRPAQADNLHLDIWHLGHNLLRDSGTYKYNTEPATIAKFAGSGGHNSPTLGRLDHMLKGPRFIWFYWTPEATLHISPDGLTITARVRAFLHAKPEGVWLTRTVTIDPAVPAWVITDETEDNLGLPLRQHWHPIPGYGPYLTFTAQDPDSGLLLEPSEEPGLYSGYYGRKQEAPHLVFETKGRRICTHVRVVKNLPSSLYPDQPLED